MGRQSSTTKSRRRPADLLETVPVRNESTRTEQRDGGEVVVFVPTRRRWFTGPPFTWVFPLRDERGFHLDRLGTEVWQAIDGRRTLEQIIERFASRHRLSFHEARLSVETFLRDLTGRGIVVMVGRSKSGAGR
jgi:hypothetical protein